MSLRAKLEAVIYAAEEPVTLTQLASLFAADALEWKAAQAAAAAEQIAEVAAAEADRQGENMPLLSEGLEYLGLEQSPTVYAEVNAQTAAAEAAEPGTEPEAAASENPEAVPAVEAAAPDPVVDVEAENKRLARQRDREVKAVLRQLLDELIASYDSDNRGVEIREIAGGYRVATKPECHDAVRMFVKSLKPAMKLSLPALETLAVIAYKQPVTAPEVNEIRGVESGGVLGSLLTRKLIATAGRKQVIGRPILYKTTKEFLLRFGLKDVSELPSMEEFEKMAAIEMEEMEPEATAADEATDATEAAADAEGMDAEAASEDEGPGAEEQPAATELSGAPTEPTTVNATESETPQGLPVDETEAADLPAERPAPNTNEAAPAEPDSTEQAETETNPHGEESHQEEPQIH